MPASTLSIDEFAALVSATLIDNGKVGGNSSSDINGQVRVRLFLIHRPLNGTEPPEFSCQLLFLVCPTLIVVELSLVTLYNNARSYLLFLSRL